MTSATKKTPTTGIAMIAVRGSFQLFVDAALDSEVDWLFGAVVVVIVVGAADAIDAAGGRIVWMLWTASGSHLLW